MTTIELRNKLRSLGYDARLVNGDCFDVHQDGHIHYLSRTEAEMLDRSGLTLADYGERRGLNYWYDFDDRGVRISPDRAEAISGAKTQSHRP